MATSRSWSRSVGVQRGTRARVFERYPGSALYVSVWLAGGGESRRSLGHRDRRRAVQEVEALLALDRETAGREESVHLTLGDLFRQYTTDGKYLPDGSLKTEAYLQHIIKTGENLAKHFGTEYTVSDLTPDRIGEYVRLRREGAITGNKVRTNAIQRELMMLKGALNWACARHVNGAPLLTRSPLEKYKIPREKDPKRPTLDAPEIDRLEAAAPDIHPFLHTLIVLARTTGRRLSALLALRWDDIDFVKGRICWRAEHDKLGKTWIIPASKRTLAELARFRSEHPGIGPALLFPHPKRRRHPGKPVTRHLAGYWLKRVFEASKVAKPAGSLWHMFRRVWATSRKHLPASDVAAAGGWKDLTTLLTVYQQPDEQTLRSVMEYEVPRPAKPLQAREAGV